MPAESQSDALSILNDSPRGFDTAMRGYDRRQVDEHLGRLEDEVRAATNERDGFAARSSDLAAQLASSFAQVESLRRQLRSATDPITDANLDERIRGILAAAHADANRIRHEAETYVEQLRRATDEAVERTRTSARGEADQILQAATQRHVEADEAFRRRIAEADRYRVEIVERTAAEVEAARLEEEHLTTQAEAERTRLDSEAAARRAELEAQSSERIAQAERDFELALRQRRTSEAARSAAEIAAASAQAHELVTSARTEADRLVAAATARVAELDALHSRTRDEVAALLDRLGDVIATVRPAIEPPAIEPPAIELSTGPDGGHDSEGSGIPEASRDPGASGVPEAGREADQAIEDTVDPAPDHRPRLHSVADLETDAG